VRAAQRVLVEQRAAGWLSLALAHGKTFRYGGALATCDAELTHQLLMERAHTHQRSQLYKLIARLIPGSDGLLFMDGATWVRHARALLPVFTRSNVARYAQIIHETTLTHAAQWTDGLPGYDLFAEMMRLGADVVLRVGFGLDPSGALGARLARELIGYKAHTMNAIVRLDEFGFAWSKLWSLPRLLAGLWQLRRRVTSLQSIVREILEARRSREENGSDWIGQLIAAGFSLPVITDGVNHLYGAFNAVDFSVTCALYELSRQPAWRERLRVELDTRLGQRAFPTLDDLAALPEMSNFRREVFRRYPVAMGIVRRTGAPIEAGSWNIRAGSEVMILLYALHHHPNYWDEPEVFNPDRWRAAPEPKAPGSYAPFLAGPRQCVGRHLAELHFVVVLSALLRHYDIAALDHTMQMTPYLIPRFDRAMPFVARRRLVPGSDDTAGPEHTERGRV
jgi:cytochrome P450